MLILSHDAFRDTHTRFHEFREAVARATGGEFRQYDAGTAFWHPGPGYSLDTHPGLDALFAASDLDGYLDQEQVHALIAELTQLLPHIPGDDGRIALQLLEGLQRADHLHQPLVFVS